jgi:hypothetical protein
MVEAVNLGRDINIGTDVFDDDQRMRTQAFDPPTYSPWVNA